MVVGFANLHFRAQDRIAIWQLNRLRAVLGGTQVNLDPDHAGRGIKLAAVRETHLGTPNRGLSSDDWEPLLPPPVLQEQPMEAAPRERPTGAGETEMDSREPGEPGTSPLAQHPTQVTGSPPLISLPAGTSIMPADGEPYSSVPQTNATVPTVTPESQATPVATDESGRCGRSGTDTVAATAGRSFHGTRSNSATARELATFYPSDTRGTTPTSTSANTVALGVCSPRGTSSATAAASNASAAAVTPVSPAPYAWRWRTSHRHW